MSDSNYQDRFPDFLPPEPIPVAAPPDGASVAYPPPQSGLLRTPEPADKTAPLD